MGLEKTIFDEEGWIARTSSVRRLEKNSKLDWIKTFYIILRAQSSIVRA
jgi:hypothetical protein